MKTFTVIVGEKSVSIEASLMRVNEHGDLLLLKTYTYGDPSAEKFDGANYWTVNHPIQLDETIAAFSKGSWNSVNIEE